MAEAEGKKLTELRVIDLKTELERRGLDKTGNKAALLDRLSKAIREEGNNPDEVLIIPGGGHSKIPPPPKKPVETPVVVEEPPVEPAEPEIQKEESSNDVDSITKKDESVVDHNETSNTSNLEEPEISINAHPEDFDMEYHESEHEAEQQPEPESETKEQPEPEQEMEQEAAQEVEQEEAVADKNEEPDKKDYLHSEENSNISAIEANGIDNEDSINLTIGEDEQLESLLADELEPTTKHKDGGAKKKTEESQNDDKKGDSKGSGRADIAAGSGDKEGATSSSSSTSAAAPNKEADGTKSSDASGKGPKKDDKDKAAASTTTSRNLWVSGLSSTTRATDLKSIFSKYGKVIGAKVVTNAKTPGARCYGYVTMSTSDDAEKCIQHLHRTELHGRVISVEKAKGDAQAHSRKRETTAKTEKPEDKEKSESKDKELEKNQDEKKDDESSHDAIDKSADDSNDREKRETSENKDEGSLKDCDTRSNKSSGRRSDRERGRSEDKKRSWDRKASRSKSRDRNRSRDNEERERQRVREKERVVREEKRRRREDVERQRAIEREAARLEREREKLRMERERIEQEKAELLRLERERQKVEREKLERERLELKRLQMRQEETRRGGGAPPVPAGLKRPAAERREGREGYEPERKRIATEHSTSRRHSPPTARFESRSKDIPVQKSFKPRPDFASSRNARDDYSDPRGAGRDVVVRRDGRPNEMDHRPPKERYERPSNFQRDREVHRPDDTHRSSRDTHNRYENSKPPRDNRYVENRPTGWHSGPPSKPYNPTHNRGEQTGWNSRSSDTRPSNPRWNNSNNMGNNMGGHPRSQMYQGGPQYGMSQGNSGPYERYDSYKGSMQNMRKY